MQSYYFKIFKLQQEGKISVERAHQLLVAHRLKLEKRRKYKPGDLIKTLDELLMQEWVMWHGRTTHIEVVKSLQLRIVIDSLVRGGFCKAIKKEKLNAKKND